MTTKYSYERNTEQINRACKELLQCTDERDFVGADATLIAIEEELVKIKKKLLFHKHQG